MRLINGRVEKQKNKKQFFIYFFVTIINGRVERNKSFAELI